MYSRSAWRGVLHSNHKSGEESSYKVISLCIFVHLQGDLPYAKKVWAYATHFPLICGMCELSKST